MFSKIKATAKRVNVVYRGSLISPSLVVSYSNGQPKVVNHFALSALNSKKLDWSDIEMAGEMTFEQ